MTEPPFGACAPSALQRWARAGAAAATGTGAAARVARSALFTLAGGRARAPRDVAVFGGQRARLHPYDNLSEKRVYRCEAAWDPAERAFIAAKAAAGAGPFHFLDVGANAGLYTLAARAAAQAAGRRFRAVAVEPQPEMLARLRFNLAASGAEEDVAVAPWAAAAERGAVLLSAGARNRGEAQIGASGVEVSARPLADALELGGLDGVDVMKIDIEGREGPVLDAYFDAESPDRWPRAIVIEAGRGDLSLPGPAACLARGYIVAETTRMNALLEAPAP